MKALPKTCLEENKEFRPRNYRAERGLCSDKFLLRASAHPAEHFYIAGNAVSVI